MSINYGYDPTIEGIHWRDMFQRNAAIPFNITSELVINIENLLECVKCALLFNFKMVIYEPYGPQECALIRRLFGFKKITKGLYTHTITTFTTTSTAVTNGNDHDSEDDVIIYSAKSKRNQIVYDEEGIP